MTFRFSINKGELAVVHETVSKNSPTIIFLHDSLGCIRTWRDFPERLAQKTGCNYLVYDRLGYGESSPDSNVLKRKTDYLNIEAEILIDMIERLKIAKPILFGHSDGASIALIAASKSNNIILGVIAEAGHIFVEEITLEGIRKVKKKYPHGKLRKKLLQYHGSKTDDVFHGWTNTWLNDDFRKWNIEPVLPQIGCSCLIIQGENDEFGSVQQVAGIAQGIQGEAKKAFVKNVGHTPHKEDSDLTLKISTDFITKLKQEK